jgi:hypothetical protein
MVLFSTITIAKQQGNFAATLQYHPTAGEKYTSADFLAHSGIITINLLYRKLLFGPDEFGLSGWAKENDYL